MLKKVLHIRICKFETAPDHTNNQNMDIYGYWTVITSKINGVRISGQSFPVFRLLSSIAAQKEVALGTVDREDQ
jgi:hypothetical protein